MAVVLTILVVVAVVVASKGKKEDADDKSVEDIEIEVDGGVAESIFDDEPSGNEESKEDGTTSEKKENDPETPEEVTIGDEPAKSTGKQENGKKNEQSNKSDKKDKSDSSNKDSSNKKPSGDAPSVKEDGKMTYEQFHAMDPANQQAYMESFDDIEEFFEWYNKAKEKYEKDHPSIEIDGGSIDLDKIANE